MVDSRYSLGRIVSDFGAKPSVSQLGDFEILEADLHGRADVGLEGDDARIVKLRVNAIHDARAVEFDLDVLAFRGDHEIVPIAVLDQCLGLGLG